MNAAIPQGGNPLDQLADIHLPEPVALFPWAPGWWLLLALVLAILASISAYGYRHWQRTAWQRQALQELNKLPDIADDHALARQLNQLLRRAWIHCCGQQHAGVCGAHWLAILNNHHHNDSQFENMLTCCYASGVTLQNRQMLLVQSRQWLKRLPNTDFAAQTNDASGEVSHA